MLFLVASLANAFYCDDGNEKDYSQEMGVFEGVTNSQMKSYKETQGFYCGNFLRDSKPSLIYNTFTKEKGFTQKEKGKNYSPT